MIKKHLLVADRVRRPPREGFSWIDRRFLRHFASRLTGDAIFLYFFLATYPELSAVRVLETPCLPGRCGRRGECRATNRRRSLALR